MIKLSNFIKKDSRARLRRFHRTNNLLKISQQDAGLGLQVFLAGMNGDGRIDKESLEKFLAEKGKVKSFVSPNKPNGHIFWTSSLKKQQSAWLEWCTYDMPKWIGKQAAIIKPGGRVVHIRSMKDYEFLYTKYPIKSDPNSSDPRARYLNDPYSKPLDWAAVARDWDGVHMTEDGMWKTREYTYGWDVESTAWLNPTVLAVERIVDVKHHCSIPEGEDEPSPYGGKYTLEGTEDNE